MKRQGFATIVALILVALVAAALSAMAVALHVEKTRTQSAQTQAALRQLLLAGTADALERSHSWPESIVATDWSVELPPELPAKDVHLSAKLIPSGTADATVRMTATIGNHHAEQQIQFHHDENGWSAKTASLGG
jgi:hypothetical protein